MKRVRFEGRVYNVPDNATDDEIATYVEGQVAAAPKAAAADSGVVLAPGAPPLPLSRRSELPSLLATPGGFVPGPIGVGLSALGGMAGRGLQGGEMGPTLPIGAVASSPLASLIPLEVWMEGIRQGALGGGGALLGGASRRLAKPFMSIALRPKLKMGKMEPGLIENALEQGATVSGNIVGGGSRGTGRELGKRGAVTTTGIERVERQGIPLPGGGTARIRVQMSRIIPKMDDVIARKTSKLGPDRAEAQRVIDEMKDSYQGAQTLADVKAIKQQLQDEARAIWETAMPKGGNLRFNNKGIPIGEEVPIEVRIKFGAAHNLQKLMESIPEAATGIKGGFKASEAATGRAIGVHRAVKEAEAVQRSGVPWWLPGTVGRGTVAATGAGLGFATGDDQGERMRNAALGAGAGATLAHPAVASRLAWLLYQQGALPAVARQSPRLMDMLFNAGEMPPDTLRQQ